MVEETGLLKGQPQARLLSFAVTLHSSLRLNQNRASLDQEIIQFGHCETSWLPQETALVVQTLTVCPTSVVFHVLPTAEWGERCSQQYSSIRTPWLDATFPQR
jgi:hypothetical protein